MWISFSNYSWSDNVNSYFFSVISFVIIVWFIFISLNFAILLTLKQNRITDSNGHDNLLALRFLWTEKIILAVIQAHSSEILQSSQPQVSKNTQKKLGKISRQKKIASVFPQIYCLVKLWKFKLRSVITIHISPSPWHEVTTKGRESKAFEQSWSETANDTRKFTLRLMLSAVWEKNKGK